MSNPKIALIGAGPASLTVARDLAPLGYDITLIDAESRGERPDRRQPVARAQVPGGDVGEHLEPDLLVRRDARPEVELDGGCARHGRAGSSACAVPAVAGRAGRAGTRARHSTATART